MTKQTTRRAVLAGAAALPVLSLPAIAIPAQVDPVFAAIERHRQADAAHARSCLGEPRSHEPEFAEWERVEEFSCHAAHEALGDLLGTTPTTIAGCAAALRYVEAYTTENGSGGLFHNYAVKDRAADLLSRIAGTLAGQAVQS
jgi:hypothetical protein